MPIPVLPNVRTLVNTLATQPIQLERQGDKVQNQFGGWGPGPISVFTVNPVSVHQQVPEADRTTEIVKFIARESSFPAGQQSGFRVADDGYQSDVAIYRGRRFRIVGVRDFVEQGDVWIALGALEDRQARP